jgi:transposase, IS5 family
MIVDRYDPVNLFELVPKLMTGFEPELRELDRLLEDDLILQRLKADLARRAPHSLTRGRHSTPVEVILRLFVVKRLYQWSYEQTEHFVADSLVLRQFCRVYAMRVPDTSTLIRWATLIQPATLQHLLDHVVELARQNRVTRGRKLRLDSTVVATNIHYPVDSTLLADGARVLTRTIQRAKAILAPPIARGRTIFRNRLGQFVA